jgi:hypothetical protein
LAFKLAAWGIASKRNASLGDVQLDNVYLLATVLLMEPFFGSFAPL